MRTSSPSLAANDRWQRLCLWVALFVWLATMLTSAGSPSVDPATRFDVAEQVLRTGQWWFDAPGRHTVEDEGRHYSVFFPGQTLMFLPSATLGVLAERLLDLTPTRASIFARFVATVVVVPAGAAMAVLGHLVLLGRLGVGPRVATVSGVVLGLGTPMWVWASNTSEEAWLAAFGVWAFCGLADAAALARGPDEPGTSRAIADRCGWAAVLLAIGLIHRSTFMAIAIGAVVAGLLIISIDPRRVLRAWPRLLAWCVLALAIVALVPLYCWMRFGDPLDTGYTRFYEPIGGVFSTPLLTGLLGHLVSPGKSVFVYTPWLLLVPVGLLTPSLWRSRWRILIPIMVIVILHLVVYSLHTFWAGAFGWAVRFNITPLPVVMIPAALWLDRFRPRPVAVAWAAGVLAASSIAVQTVGNALNYGLEHRQYPEYHEGYRHLIPDEAAWTWRASQLRLRIDNIAIKLSGRPIIEMAPDDPQHILTVWNIFPMRASVALGQGRVVAVLWGAWGLLLLGTVAAGAGTVGAIRRSPVAEPP